MSDAIQCEVCGDGGPLRTVYRVNQPGEMPARWRCKTHLTFEQEADIDPDVKAITDLIEQNDLDNETPAKRDAGHGPNGEPYAFVSEY